MTKKHTGAKRPRGRATPNRRKSVLNSRVDDVSLEAQMEKLWTIKMRSFFQRVLGTTAGDLRSFQIYKTDSGYQTVYLKDPPTSARSPSPR
jgi:hypothetical protein